MKILHVIPEHPSASSFVFAKRQVQDLKLEGHENEIFYFSTAISILGFLKQYIAFRKRISIFQPDIIHAHYGTYTGFFASFLHRVPFFVTFQGSDINHTKDIHPYREKLGKWMSKKAASKAKGIICVSQKILESIPANQEKAVVIPCGIDIRIFQPMDKQECQKKLGLDPQKIYIFFNANNPMVKRLDIAQAVVRKLNNQYQVELLSLNGSIQPDVIPTFINASSLVLLCSDSEGSPMIIKEALACEIPIVSVNVGDVLDRIKGVSNCFIVPQNINAIHKQIAHLIEFRLFHTNGREKLKSDELDSITTIQKIIAHYKLGIQSCS